MPTPQIGQLMAELNTFMTKDSLNDHEKQWAIKQTTDPDLQAQLKQLSTTDIKIIAQLAEREATHAKALPTMTGLSQATISRGLTKLAKLGLAAKFRSLQNNKEILVHLTTAGQQVAQLHDKLDAAIAVKASAIAADYSAAELDRFIGLMAKINQIEP